MPTDLLTHPACLSHDLGVPLPDDQHAVSVCLPLWEHNIGYEEGDSAVLNALQTAYPRFQLHPSIQAVCAKFIDTQDCRGLPFSGPKAAQRAIDYVRYHGVSSARQHSLTTDKDGSVAVTSPVAVTVNSSDIKILRQYWQHAGENLSSRGAELLLNDRQLAISETASRIAVRRRKAELHCVSAENVFLFPSGMAAIAAAWRTTQSVAPGLTCQFGFPYVDTLKIQQRFPAAQHLFLQHGHQEDLQALKDQCRIQPPVAIFVEAPTNPLLVTPDIEALRQLADDHGILLVVDDTLAACTNLQLLPFADIVVTSLTKFFSGRGNVLAGSLVVNPHGRQAAQLSHALNTDFEEQLCDADCDVLAANSEDLQQRIRQTNQNAKCLADFLRQHELVSAVHFTDQCEVYRRLMTAGSGFGGLLSIELRNGQTTAPAFYDALQVCKGPNLGTYFTLACPFTILAHYEELEWAESCGVSRWLIRVSVGVEPTEELIRRFTSALDFVRNM